MKAACRDGWHVLHLMGERKKRQQLKVTALWRWTADLQAITYRDKETVWRAEVIQEGKGSKMPTRETSVAEVRFSRCFRLDSSRCPPPPPPLLPASILFNLWSRVKPGLLDINALSEGFRKVLWLWISAAVVMLSVGTRGEGRCIIDGLIQLDWADSHLKQIIDQHPGVSELVHGMRWYTCSRNTSVDNLVMRSQCLGDA